MNSGESFLFHKSKLLFGIFQAQKHIREKDVVVVVEGYFDVLALHAAGFQNVVATCGTALSPEHLALLSRFASQITILFDGDRAGNEATEKAMELGLDKGMVLFGASMPAGLDPDEVLFDLATGSPKPQGIEQMQAILAGAQPLIDTRIAELATQASRGPEDRTRALKRVAQWLARFADPVGRQIRVEEVLKTFGVTRSTLQQALGDRPLPSAPPKAPTLPTPKASPPRKSQRWELILLDGLIRRGPSDEIFQEARANLPQQRDLSALFIDEQITDFIKFISLSPTDAARFSQSVQSQLDSVENAQLRALMTEALMGGEPRFSAEELKTAVKHAIHKFWARFSQQIRSAMAEAEAGKNADLLANLMKEYLDVQRKLKEFTSFYDEG